MKNERMANKEQRKQELRSDFMDEEINYLMQDELNPSWSSNFISVIKAAAKSCEGQLQESLDNKNYHQLGIILFQAVEKKLLEQAENIAANRYNSKKHGE